ncbi:MAG: KTSC domain-containing protein [Thermoguttaceae bacterium]
MPFSHSPLFTVASEAIQLDIKRRFAQSDYGQLIRAVERTYNRPASQAAIERILRQWKGTNPQRTIEQLMGADFGSLVRTVEKYARSGGSGGLGKRLLMKFLSSMGPAGNILKSLATANKTPAGYRSSLNDAMALIRAMGGEVIPGKDWGTVEDVDRAVRAMQQRLEEMNARGEKMERPPTQEARRMQPGPRNPDIAMSAGGSRKFPPNHPIVTGDMVPTPGSSNVYEFGYDADSSYLYVRFKLNAAPKEQVRPNAPGSLYRYANVTPEEFLSLYKLRNHAGNGGGPGDWVWDNLRERGTVSGHKKDYELVGIMGGYVPRKATLVKENNQLVEYFVPRLIKTTEGKWLRSRKPRELAPTSGFMVGERGVGGGPRSGRNNPRG